MSNLVLASPDVPESFAEHRLDYWQWIEQNAEPAMRDTLMLLREHWSHCNTAYFDSRMLEPYITLTQPSAPVILGQCCWVSSWGSRLEIKIRPSLLAGTHPLVMRNGLTRAGRLQFVKDVLLHEMIHQHISEHEPGVDESAYHGHGPVFTAHANRIGAMLGLAAVVVRNRKGKPKQPKSAQWPHCVAPPDRYGAPLVWWDEPVTDSGDTAAAAQPVEQLMTWYAGRAWQFDSWGTLYDALDIGNRYLGTMLGTLESRCYRVGRTVKIPLAEADDLRSELLALRAALLVLIENRPNGEGMSR